MNLKICEFVNDEKGNIILEKTILFSLDVTRYVEVLESRKKFVIANQLLKSGTSIGANIHKAQNTESKSDFIHKFKITAKEIEETAYWLTLCKNSEHYPNCENLIQSLDEIKRITNKIISSSKRKEPILI